MIDDRTRAALSAANPNPRAANANPRVAYFTAPVDLFGSSEYDSALETVRKRLKQTVIDAECICRRDENIAGFNVGTVIVLPRDGEKIDESVWNELNMFARRGGVALQAIVDGKLSSIIGRCRAGGYFARLELHNIEGLLGKPRRNATRHNFKELTARVYTPRKKQGCLTLIT